MSDILSRSELIFLASGMISIATPLLFGAFGELITERGGS